MPTDAKGNYVIDPAIAQALGPRPSRFGSSLLGFAQGLSGQPVNTPWTQYQQAAQRAGLTKYETDVHTGAQKDLMGEQARLQNQARMEKARIETEALRGHLETLLGPGNPEIAQALSRIFIEKLDAGQNNAAYWQHAGQAEHAKGRLGGENELGQTEIEAERQGALAKGSKAQNQYLGDKGAQPFVFGLEQQKVLTAQAQAHVQQLIAQGMEPGAAVAAAMEQAAKAMSAMAGAQFQQAHADQAGIQTPGVQAKTDAEIAKHRNEKSVSEDPATLAYMKDEASGQGPFNLMAGQSRVYPKTGEAVTGNMTPKIIPADTMTGTPAQVIYGTHVGGMINGKPVHTAPETPAPPFTPDPNTPKLPTFNGGLQQGLPSIDQVPQWQGNPAQPLPSVNNGPQDGQVFDPAELEKAFRQPPKPTAPVNTEQQQPQPQSPRASVSPFDVPKSVNTNMPSAEPMAAPPQVPTFQQGAISGQQRGDGHDLINVIKSLLKKQSPQPAR